MLWWSREYPVIEASREEEVKEDTACNVYQWLRDVCSTKLLTMPITLGGPGVICIQIDDSLFHHKPKVTANYIKLLYYTNSILESYGKTNNK